MELYKHNLPGVPLFAIQSSPIFEVIEFEGYKFSRLGRFVSLLVPMNTLVLISLFAARIYNREM